MNQEMKMGTDDSAAQDRSKARAAAYSAAETRLRNLYQDKFQEFLAEECDKRGVTYKPRLTAEQKAKQEIADLLSKHPDLNRYYGAPAVPSAFPTEA